MAIGYGTAAPKPVKRATVKARATRHARAVVTDVRAAVVERDGMCRVPARLGPCQGVLEWAHMPDFRRSKTLGQPAEARHTSEGSFMCCTRHHAMLDQHQLTVTALTDRGADGTLRFEVRA